MKKKCQSGNLSLVKIGKKRKKYSMEFLVPLYEQIEWTEKIKNIFFPFLLLVGRLIFFSFIIHFIFKHTIKRFDQLKNCRENKRKEW